MVDVDAELMQQINLDRLPKDFDSFASEEADRSLKLGVGREFAYREGGSADLRKPASCLKMTGSLRSGSPSSPVTKSVTFSSVVSVFVVDGVNLLEQKQTEILFEKPRGRMLDFEDAGQCDLI
mmetsp:Transcript_6603/g.19996  ORF Transcript_6603/g.19996 Transcript_6603/m.19996 type:complete len:123 (-) Transcript_6603:448-816(-)